MRKMRLLLEILDDLFSAYMFLGDTIYTVGRVLKSTIGGHEQTKQKWIDLLEKNWQDFPDEDRAEEIAEGKAFWDQEAINTNLDLHDLIYAFKANWDTHQPEKVITIFAECLAPKRQLVLHWAAQVMKMYGICYLNLNRLGPPGFPDGWYIVKGLLREDEVTERMSFEPIEEIQVGRFILEVLGAYLVKVKGATSDEMTILVSLVDKGGIVWDLSCKCWMPYTYDQTKSEELLMRGMMGYATDGAGKKKEETE
ncbi:uncharacterized protein SPPG_06029 [Spizellomyces punctatus DAOM BR117]|uniref:Uncharacterized protein n=1 Tax=Spizellomyces punctatus (strain DAOM BR117) TaxID=645134 RepID=A0A0L0HD92_SPIPD|nr:uncharacterized protein SPPG_06029 [Spizellomyces punctatus DAOM BR117]KNC99082.1 hypothetical protein SPPG_06029 [Spizellomyces punctatus DAOM BR117]|eukprot:XP_016607122.1 hypothetical protein SPPG_06029 [Spizellomyces punctatus DAOM BR117]